MLETVKDIFTFIRCWSDVFLIAAGFIALVVYAMQKRDQKRAAATLLKSQIDSIENIVKELKSKEQLSNVVLYKSPVILSRNYWEESKHLLIKELGIDGVKLLEEFYRQTEQLEKSRAAICHELTVAWEHKDFIIQEKYFTFSEATEPNTKNQITDNINSFKGIEDIFAAGLPINILLDNLRDFRLLSGTTAYDKLSRISYYRG